MRLKIHLFNQPFCHVVNPNLFFLSALLHSFYLNAWCVWGVSFACEQHKIHQFRTKIKLQHQIFIVICDQLCIGCYWSTWEMYCMCQDRKPKPSTAAVVGEMDFECWSNLQPHGENSWFSWSGEWRWKMLHLREIGSRHKSYINMILRQVPFSILTAYFLSRQMSDVSMGATRRELTAVCSFPRCWKHKRILFVKRTERKGKDMLNCGKRFSDWEQDF